MHALIGWAHCAPCPLPVNAFILVRIGSGQEVVVVVGERGGVGGWVGGGGRNAPSQSMRSFWLGSGRVGSGRIEAIEAFVGSNPSDRPV